MCVEYLEIDHYAGDKRIINNIEQVSIPFDANAAVVFLLITLSFNINNELCKALPIEDILFSHKLLLSFLTKFIQIQLISRYVLIQLCSILFQGKSLEHVRTIVGTVILFCHIKIICLYISINY